MCYGDFCSCFWEEGVGVNYFLLVDIFGNIKMYAKFLFHLCPGALPLRMVSSNNVWYSYNSKIVR